METEVQMNRWLNRATDDSDIADELNKLLEQGDTAGIEDRFYRELVFGTGGLRGVIGAGSNRLNVYTVRKATQGLAAYLQDTPLQGVPANAKQAVAIAYDSRIKSDLFANEAARVLAANGLQVYLYPRLMPTPALSFAVRHLGCSGGICITASHNPAEYNGYKVYGADGGQITTAAADAIYARIQQVDPFDDVKLVGFNDALTRGDIRMIDEETVDAFLDSVLAQRVEHNLQQPLRVVYTPLNGTGRECVTRALEAIGITDVAMVPEQAHPDGNFPTCPQPNPENEAALQLGYELSRRLGYDILLATDPDCDRIGVAVKDGEAYVRLSGNEIGVLLLDYICRLRQQNSDMPSRPVAVKTIVTTDMAQPIARHYGIELREVLTGFKYIGEQIGLLEQNGEGERFIFGFEESCGYLSGGYVRDKDAVGAAVLVCDMARHYKAQGKTLVQAMQSLYEQYGHYNNELYSHNFTGREGAQQMPALLRKLRTEPPRRIAGIPVLSGIDYMAQPEPGHGDAERLLLPPSDVLEYSLQDNSKITIRPSGTEPKIKYYITTKGDSSDAARQQNHRIADGVQSLLGLH